MTDLNQWLKQRKTLITAFMVASGSFVMGVTLPIDLQLNNLGKVLSDVQHQLVTPNVVNVTTTKPNVVNVTTTKPNVVNVTTTKPDVVNVTNVVDSQINNKQKEILAILAQKQLSLAIPSRFQGSTVNKAKLYSKEKLIALTFDDGPWPESTEKILDILKKNKIKATFFMVGRYLKAYADLGKKVAADGHAIGNHSWNHRYFKYTEAGAAKEIDRTNSLIQEVTGLKVSMFRPPGGVLTNGLAAYAEKKKYTVIIWSADSLDWRNSMKSLKQSVLRQATSGGIVLMHDGGGNRSNTVVALPSIIADLKKQGYRFVTVPELLRIQDKEMKNHQIVVKANH
jgi:peptidoglycan-N-acetylglucosamine deacetylase